MMWLLPTEILDCVDLNDFSLNNYPSHSPIGFILDVDLDYSDELHDVYKYYPLTAEKIKLTKKIVFKYQLKIKEETYS